MQYAAARCAVTSLFRLLALGLLRYTDTPTKSGWLEARIEAKPLFAGWDYIGAIVVKVKDPGGRLGLGGSPIKRSLTGRGDVKVFFSRRLSSPFFPSH